MDIYTAIENLRDWKNLPAYRAEPRVDFVFSVILPELLRQRYQVACKAIIPEFPIRIGTVYPNLKTDKSFKVDFYALLENGDNIFIEFKTDMSSRTPKQDRYLDALTRIGFKDVLEGILQIYNATAPRYRPKYEHLLNKLVAANLIVKDGQSFSTANVSYRNQILYVQPRSILTNSIGFNQVSELMDKCSDPVMKKFAELFLVWSVGGK